ncbi:MAG: AgmX/PglI C-terminal domain-containing protein [Oligoflexales bacterium]|nr:AgmX/PglI C-terminal domain-containing protein [Oligoflexales bacterium]
MASATNKKFISIELLQNGATIAQYSCKLNFFKSLKISSIDGENLSIPGYKFASKKSPRIFKRLKFGKIFRKQLRLRLDDHWSGFIVHSGALLNLEETPQKSLKTLRQISLNQNDYASLVFSELRLLIKFSDKLNSKSLKEKTTRLDKSFRSGILGYIDSYARKPILLSLFVAFSLFMTTIGLFNTKSIHLPKDMLDLNPNYTLAYLHPKLIETAPEALQNIYSRSNLLNQIIEHYTSVGLLVGAQELHKFPDSVYPSTINRFQRNQRNHTEQITTLIEKQEFLEQELLKNEAAGVLYFPGVIGETNSGSLSRIIDTISLNIETHAENLKQRKQASAEYNNDTLYDYLNYKEAEQLKNKGNTSSALEKISRDLMYKPMSPELAMYEHATRLSGKSRLLAKRLAANTENMQELEPLYLDTENGGLSFNSEHLDLLASNKKIEELKALAFPNESSHQNPKRSVTGTIAQASISSTINRHMIKIRQCYERALRKNRELRGNLSWIWLVTENGRTSDITLASGSISDKEMIQCIEGHIANFYFNPAPRSGAVRIAHSFEFAPESG